MGKRVNQTELAEILGVSDVTVWEWQKIGMPILERGDRGEANVYDSAAVIKWKIDAEVRKVRDESPRDALYRVQRDLVELNIAKERRELVEVSEVLPAWQRMILAARQRLLAIPERLAHLLESTAGVDGKRALLRDEVDTALNELSNYEPNAGTDSQGVPAVGAAGAH